MIEAEDAVEAVAYTQLNVTAVTALAAVYQHVPEDTPPPVVIIGDMDSEPIGGKGDPDRRVNLVVIAVIQAEERKPLRAIQAEINAQLDGKSFAHEGWELHFTFTGSDGALLEDGATYVGNTRFTVLAFSDA